MTLRWTVDESRANRIAGFSCVFRSPAHLRIGMPGAVACQPSFESVEAGARSATLVELPEYGEYQFELTVLTDTTGPVVAWPDSHLRLTLDVTEEFAGPPGTGRAVSGAGPLVEGCGPGGLPDAGDPSWRLDQVVSAAHLTHFPGRGWMPAGDPDAAPEWPEAPSLAELMSQAGSVAGQGDGASDGLDPDSHAVLWQTGVFDRVGAGTKALLRASPTSSPGGHELRLHTSYPFSGVYAYGDAHAVEGWNAPGSEATWPSLRRRTDCPPPDLPHATHSVALALGDSSGDGHGLEHSGYGWWTVSPVALFPERIVAAAGGLSFGDAASEPPAAGTGWQGRVSGHLFWDQRRWALSGDLTLELERDPAGGEPRLSGRIDNVVLVALDLDSLAPQPAPALPWRSLTLAAVALGGGGTSSGSPTLDGEGLAGGGGWSGRVSVGLPAQGEPAAMPAADAFEGDWRAAAYGPGGAEIAGRLRLWTPLAPGADPATDWTEQAVLVAGFGGIAP